MSQTTTSPSTAHQRQWEKGVVLVGLLALFGWLLPGGWMMVVGFGFGWIIRAHWHDPD